MKPFDVDVYLKYPKSVLLFVGMWPKKSPSFKYKLRGFLSFFLTGSLSLLICMRGAYDIMNGNIQSGALNLCTTLASGHAAYKIALMQYKKGEFFKLFEILQCSELISHEDYLDVYLQNRLKLGTKVFTFQFLSCLCSGSLNVIKELVSDYNSIPSSLPPTYIDENKLISLISVWIYFILAAICTGYVIGSYEGLMFNLLSLAVIQIQMLRKQITKSIDSYSIKALSVMEMQQNDRLVNQLLKTCIKRHNAIERYVQSMEVKFSNSYLIQFIITLFVTALMGLNFIFATLGSVTFTRCVLFLCADLAQVVALCIPCNEIIVQSEKIRDACYMSSWRICGPSICKTLFIIMERTKRPLYLTAGKFTIISLETFLSLLKMTMSYFTVLKTLYGDSK